MHRYKSNRVTTTGVQYHARHARVHTYEIKLITICSSRGGGGGHAGPVAPRYTGFEVASNVINRDAGPTRIQVLYFHPLLFADDWINFFLARFTLALDKFSSLVFSFPFFSTLTGSFEIWAMHHVALMHTLVVNIKNSSVGHGKRGKLGWPRRLVFYLYTSVFLWRTWLVGYPGPKLFRPITESRRLLRRQT